MNQNFFEALGIANIERIHSQMLAWIFNGHFLNSEQKSVILKSLAPKINKNYAEFHCDTEYQNIDVIIRADNDLVIIENKIKSSEHDNQLEEYKKIVETNEEFIFQFPDIKEKYFSYLSLDLDGIDSEPWINVTYEDLLASLSKFMFSNPLNAEQYIFNEYVGTIKRIVSVFDSFINDHTQFLNVFTDGSLTKREKFHKIESYKDDEDKKYIAQNQLETIFQRYFLRKIMKSMNIKYEYIVNESHGVANVQIYVKEIVRNDKEFIFGVQFQGDTVKINFARPAKDYNKSSKDELSISIVNLFKNLRDKEGLRLNAPHSKAYISISKKINNHTWDKDFESVVEIYSDEFNKCKKIIDSIDVSDIR